MPRSIVIHGHYYQPPREDPWLGEIQRQATAAPFHDWNARIEHECYSAVTAARVLDPDGHVSRIVNTLAYTSFNFGPTLLAWLDRASPATYDAVLEADRMSAARLDGHGNAMAQAYHHTILPLASRRDKTTEVRWGIADFRARFGRQPEGMWLPETAVDDETLDVLAEEGIRYTVLAPHQVTAAPARGFPGLYRTANGREIAIFVYDGSLSSAIAFGNLLSDGEAWAARLTAGLVEGDTETSHAELISAATDGETYGHHHRFGEMALAAVIDKLERRPDVYIENFASFLARHPAKTPVSLVAPSAWSCVHGIERWRADCGCGASTTSPSQSWRAPLRTAMHVLANDVHAIFERDAGAYFADPWKARNDYVASQLAGDGVACALNAAALDVRARELLELERYALQLFTSCAWFFDDVDRLEPLQIMRYAARAIDLAGAKGPVLEKQLLAHLADAPSSDPSAGTAQDIYLRSAKPHVSPYASMAAAQALLRALGVADVSFRCCVIDQNANTVVVRERQTGREHTFDVGVVVEGAVDDDLLRAQRAVVRVQSLGAPVESALYLTIEDMPESTRLALEGDTIARVG